MTKKSMRYLAPVLAMSMVLSLTACGGGNTAATTAEKQRHNTKAKRCDGKAPTTLFFGGRYHVIARHKRGLFIGLRIIKLVVHNGFSFVFDRKERALNKIDLSFEQLYHKLSINAIFFLKKFSILSSSPDVITSPT